MVWRNMKRLRASLNPSYAGGTPVEEDERRVAEILGVQAGQRLPAVSRKTLRQYHAYLTAHLVFPFQAAIEDLDGVITVKSLFKLKECPDLTFYGLFIRGNQGRRIIEIPI